VGGWPTPRPGRFTPWKDPVPIVQEAGWAPGPVWTGAENLAPTGIRSPDRPARSESLNRLSYTGLQRGNVRYQMISSCVANRQCVLKVSFSQGTLSCFTHEVTSKWRTIPSAVVYISVSQPPGRGPVPGPGIIYTGPPEVLLEFVILVF